MTAIWDSVVAMLCGVVLLCFDFVYKVTTNFLHLQEICDFFFINHDFCNFFNEMTGILVVCYLRSEQVVVCSVPTDDHLSVAYGFDGTG